MSLFDGRSKREGGNALYKQCCDLEDDAVANARISAVRKQEAKSVSTDQPKHDFENARKRRSKEFA